MLFHHHLLAGVYYPLRVAKAVSGALGGSSSESLRVLLYHDITPEEMPRFESQMRWLMHTWNFVTPEDFGAMVSGEKPIRGRNLFLTFDDGFASNRVVAEQVLNPLGIRALYFVVSDFLDLDNYDEARNFITCHIQPGKSATELPVHLYNLNWGDLEALLEQGHSVGAHTQRHLKLSQINTQLDLEREIISSADKLQHRLGVPIEHFAYTFGDLASFSKLAMAIARRRFRFIYSGLRGDNAKEGVSPLALRRDAVTARDPLSLLGTYVEGGADFRYVNSNAQLDSWI